MDNRLSFNISANSYVPRNLREQQQRPQPKYDESGIEIVYDSKGGNKNQGNSQSYSQGNNQNFSQNYDQSYTPNYNQGYDQNYNQGYDHNYNQGYDQNYTQNHDQGYDQNYTQNYDQGYDQNYTQNYDQVYDQKSTQNYDQVYDQNNEQGYNYSKTQNTQQQYSKGKRGGKNQYNQPKNQQYNQPYGQQQNTYYNEGANYTKTSSTGPSNKFATYEQGYKGKDYNKVIIKEEKHVTGLGNNYPEKQDYSYKGKANQYYDNQSGYSKNTGKGQKIYVVEKDLNDHVKPVGQDLEDDLLDQDTYAGDDFTRSELTGDFYGGEDDYMEDAGNYTGFDDLGDFDDYDDYGSKKYQDSYQSTADKFSKMTVSDTTKSASSSTGSKQHLLIFSNKEGFTNYVEELIKTDKRYSQITDSYVSILMIAEKPSIAKSISEAIGGSVHNRKLGRGNNIFNFEGYFGNVKARITVSSVMGHVYTSDFQREHNDWESIDYLDLYDVPVAKVEANKKTRIPYTLQRLAQGKDILCLWLDCDKEGENICYEVIYNCMPYMNRKSYQQVYRAKFSSLTKPDLKAAYNRLSDPPNKNESLSVDARQVIDLKIGVSFTRFLTSAVLPGIKNADTKLLSYGPCQTPTLWFCVNRQNEINQFKSKEYFKIHADVEIGKIKYKIPYRKKFFEKSELNATMTKIKEGKTATVVNVITKKNTKPAPVGLNTVQMLRVASSYLKMSPHETMVVAERLYTMGYMTYPRTETTKYAASFDILKTLNDFSSHSVFGKQITAMLKNYKKPVLRGVDVGDHPPITPSRVAAPADLKGDLWRLYEFICTSFFASVAESADFEEKIFQIDISGEIFEAESILLTKEGFLTFMPWKRSNYAKDFPMLKQDTVIPVLNISAESNWTEPPEYLSESDLIKLMEHNKIGTDASMPVHIENISQRGYVKVDGARRLIPTKLGKALIESLSAVDPELVQPSIRAEIENYVDQVAKGNKKYEDMITYAIDLYKKKFLFVRQHYEKLLNNFKKYFEIDLMEMNKVYRTIKNKNEALKLQNMVQKDISQVTTDLNTCTTCKKGKMYVEFDELDKYLLMCTNCKLRKKIVRDAVKINVIKSLQCQKCSCYYVQVEVENPFLNGETNYTGCLFCDPNLS